MALALAGAIALFGSAPASARTVEYWVAAVPTSWNVVPNGRDAIMDMPVAARGRDLPDGRLPPLLEGLEARAAQRAERSSADGLLIPGPLIRAREGDHLQIHFKNLDTLRHDPHSMHFHGVRYAPSSDGAYVPGFSGGDADVKFGQTWTYKLTALHDSVGVWPYHDHSPSMDDSIAGGMFGMHVDPRPPRAARPTGSSWSSSRRSARTSWRSTGARSSATRPSSARRSASSCSGT